MESYASFYRPYAKALGSDELARNPTVKQTFRDVLLLQPPPTRSVMAAELAHCLFPEQRVAFYQRLCGCSPKESNACIVDLADVASAQNLYCQHDTFDPYPLNATIRKRVFALLQHSPDFLLVENLEEIASKLTPAQYARLCGSASLTMVDPSPVPGSVWHQIMSIVQKET